MRGETAECTGVSLYRVGELSIDGAFWREGRERGANGGKRSVGLEGSCSEEPKGPDGLGLDPSLFSIELSNALAEDLN